MNEQAKNAVAEVYSVLQMAPTTSREDKHVMVRAAIGVALCDYMSDTAAGELIDKHRTTIKHFKRHHQRNLKQWIGYDDVYKLAKGIISITLDNSIVEGRIQGIKARIEEHEKEMATLQEALDALEVKIKNV